MKKIITILTTLFIAIQIFPVSAGIIGGVTETDIVAFIDYCPVRSYNYDGFTYVIAEDLSDYGFKVSWNENDRTLDISRDELVFASYCSDFINEKKTGRTYAKLYDVYTTDIKTFINGKEADAYNINGRTIINTADLSEYGIYSYDDRARRVDIKILEKEIENCETENTSNDYTATEKHGIFANGELAYGIEKTTYTDRFGSEYSYRYGDFQNNNYIEVTDSFKLPYLNQYKYITPEKTVNANGSDEYKYGMYIHYTEESGDSGMEYRYLPQTGELYLIKEKTEFGNIVYEDDILIDDGLVNSFYGKLFVGGNMIYDGEIKVDRFNFTSIGNGSRTNRTVSVLYVPGYTDEDGILYYFQNDSADTYDAVYYRGNVVNGVAHRYGTMYNKQYGYSDTVNTTKTLMKPDGTVEYMDCPAENVMYIGYFKDGLMDGHGTMYENSVPTFQGNHTCGIINGTGTEYKDTGSGILYVSYIGNYENNNRSGQGTEYEVKSISDLSQGLFERFVGEWKDGGWSYGKWYECVLDPNTNILTPYLYEEGSFNN